MSCKSDLYDYLVETGVLYSLEKSCEFPLMLPYEPENTDYYLFQLNYNFGQQRCYKNIKKEKDGFEEIHPFRIDKEIVAYALVNSDFIIVQFLPALTSCQWIYSFQSTPMKVNGFRVHSGMYQYYLRVKDKIIDFLEEYKDRPVIYTGYSLGGPLSVFLAMDRQPEQLLIWGSPPFIDTRGVKWIEKHLPYKGWMNLDDPVVFSNLEPIYKPVLSKSILFEIDYGDPHLNHLYAYSDFLKTK